MYHIEKEQAPPEPGPHIRAQQKYYAMRERYEHASRVSKEAWKVMQKAEGALVDAMMDNGVTSFALEDGTRVDIRRHTTVAVNNKNYDVVKGFLDKQGWDAETYMKAKLDKAAIEAEVKRQLEASELQEFDIPEGMSFKRSQSINVTGWKTRSKEL